MTTQPSNLDEVTELLRSLLSTQREANSKLHEIAANQVVANGHLKLLSDQIKNREIAGNPLVHARDVVAGKK